MVEEESINYPGERYSVRVKVSLPIWCKKIMEEELEEKKNELTLRPSNLERKDWKIPEKIKDTFDPEAGGNILPLQLLLEISHKLDRLIDLMSNKELEDPEGWKAKALDISGSGIRIISPQKIDRGDYLYLKINIPLSTVTTVEIIGKAIWVKIMDRRTTVRWEAGLRFIAINEDDREEIIRFIFQQQRMLLRARTQV